LLEFKLDVPPASIVALTDFLKVPAIIFPPSFFFPPPGCAALPPLPADYAELFKERAAAMSADLWEEVGLYLFAETPTLRDPPPPWVEEVL
jgi:hypothetical protein